VKKIFMLSMCFIIASMSVLVYAGSTAPPAIPGQPTGDAPTEANVGARTAKNAATLRTRFATSAHNYTRQVAAVEKLMANQTRAYERLVANQERAQANLINRQLTAMAKANDRLTLRATALRDATALYDFVLTSPGSFVGTIAAPNATVNNRIGALRVTLGVPADEWVITAPMSELILDNLSTPGALTYSEINPTNDNIRPNFTKALWDRLVEALGADRVRTPARS